MFRVRVQPIGIRHVFRKISKAPFGNAIPNTGSVARDHLANERTFLAWARTSLVFVGSGIGLHQFYQYAFPIAHAHDDGTEPPQHVKNTDIRKLRSNVILASSTLVVFGFGVLIFGTMRYYSVMKALRRDLFIPNSYGIATFSTLLTGLMLCGLVTTLQIPRYIFPDQEDPLDGLKASLLRGQAYSIFYSLTSSKNEEKDSS